MLTWSKWPAVLDFSLTDIYPMLADAIFGSSAYKMGRNLHPEVRRFFDTYMVHTWRRWKTVVKRQQVTVKTQRAKIAETWESECYEFRLIGRSIT